MSGHWDGKRAEAVWDDEEADDVNESKDTSDSVVCSLDRLFVGSSVVGLKWDESSRPPKADLIHFF